MAAKRAKILDHDPQTEGQGGRRSAREAPQPARKKAALAPARPIAKAAGEAARRKQLAKTAWPAGSQRVA